MAVLGNRGTGLLEMAIEAFKDQSMPNQQLAPTVPGQNTVLRAPQTVRLNPRPVATIQTNPELNRAPSMPLGQGVRATPQMMEQMAATSAATPAQAPQTARTGVPSMTPQQYAAAMPRNPALGADMVKMAEDADKVVREIQRNPQLEQDPSFMDQVKGYFGNRENMVKLAMAFNSMRLTPDTGLAAALGSELKDIRATSRAQAERNRTAAYFDKVDPEIANAIRGGLDAKDAIALHREKTKGVVVGKMIINPTTGDIIYDGSSQGSDLPDSVQKIIWGATQLGLTPGTQAYTDYITSQMSRSKGMSFRMRPDGTVEFTEGGDLGSLTEGQGKGLMFSQRMGASQRIINTVENEGTSIFNAIVSNVPFAGNLLTSPEYKLYEQAKRDFINAQLRYESGAAIGAAEFENADKQYFPQPGDTPDVIAQKRANRELAIQTMSAVSGPDAEAYAKNIRVQLFGPQAANWPDVGTEENGYRYIGGDPSIQSNWVKQ